MHIYHLENNRLIFWWEKQALRNTRAGPKVTRKANLGDKCLNKTVLIGEEVMEGAYVCCGPPLHAGPNGMLPQGNSYLQKVLTE